MPDLQHTEPVEPIEYPVSISHVVHTIRAYRPAILLSWAAVAIAYLILAVVTVIMAPSQRVTSQHFRIDFDGAQTGRYPNGAKFSTAEIVSTPLLVKVFRENQLDRFTNFADFSRAVFVLEANAEYENLATEYQSRLADLKLTPMDRDRIQKEWESKAAAIAKSDYSINYLRNPNVPTIPETLVRKVLTDVLNEWASHAIRDQHVLKYQISILSPNVLNELPVGDEDYIVRLQILRSKVVRVINNIDSLALIPSAVLVRTPVDALSLQEIRLRLEEIIRFRLEPLNGIVRASGLIKSPATTLRFLESQLAYDQRGLKAAQDQADSIRQALAVYALDQHALTAETTEASAPGRPKPANGNGETVMPQFTDSFIDRLMALTHQAGDVEYRQKLVDDYRTAAAATVPAQQEVQYDQEVLNLVRSAPAGGPTATLGAQVSKDIETSDAEIRQLISRVNEIDEIVSRNLNPATELFALTAPPTTHTERSLSLSKLALFGALTMLVSLMLIIGACLMHARVREEERIEGYSAGEDLQQ
jgi:hypothetical protein